MMQSTLETCLFYFDTCIVITYFDDCLVFAKHDDYIRFFISSLDIDYQLTNEGDIANYLGVMVTCQSNGTILLAQQALIKKITKAVGLDDSCNTVAIPILYRPIGKDLHGLPRRKIWH